MFGFDDLPGVKTFVNCYILFLTGKQADHAGYRVGTLLHSFWHVPNSFWSLCTLCHFSGYFVHLRWSRYGKSSNGTYPLCEKILTANTSVCIWCNLFNIRNVGGFHSVAVIYGHSISYSSSTQVCLIYSWDQLYSCGLWYSRFWHLFTIESTTFSSLWCSC